MTYKLKLTKVKCDFCNSNSNQIILRSKDYLFNNIPGEFSIVRCSNCSLSYLNPRINSKELKDIYKNEVKFVDNSFKPNNRWNFDRLLHYFLPWNFERF